MFHPQSGPLQSEEISEITSDRELARESFLQLDQLESNRTVYSCLKTLKGFCSNNF